MGLWRRREDAAVGTGRAEEPPMGLWRNREDAAVGTGRAEDAPVASLLAAKERRHGTATGGRREDAALAAKE